MRRFVFVLCFVFASSAFAGLEPNYADWSSMEGSCGPIDPNKPCYAGGGNTNYSTCTARGTQRCRTCAQTQINGNFICAYVMENGHCSCSDVKQPDGSTSCQAGGTCTYQY